MFIPFKKYKNYAEILNLSDDQIEKLWYVASRENLKYDQFCQRIKALVGMKYEVERIEPNGEIFLKGFSPKWPMSFRSSQLILFKK